MRSLPPVGMRTIKTAMAVVLSALVMKYIIKDTPFFACIGAAVAMEKTIKRSFNAVFIRNLGTLIGGVVGILFSLITQNVVILGLGVIVVIYLINLCKKHESIIPGCIVFFAVVYLNTPDTSWYYSLRRIVETFIGSGIGIAVNLIIKSPKGEIQN